MAMEELRYFVTDLLLPLHTIQFSIIREIWKQPSYNILETVSGLY